MPGLIEKCPVLVPVLSARALSAQSDIPNQSDGSTPKCQRNSSPDESAASRFPQEIYSCARRSQCDTTSGSCLTATGLSQSASTANQFVHYTQASEYRLNRSVQYRQRLLR